MDEIGRELKASELTPQKVYVVKPPNKPYMTLWVLSIDEHLVEFLAGELHWHILNFIQPDGSIHDDQGREVKVFEYLGEV
jgi:hypothetical protein